MMQLLERAVLFGQEKGWTAFKCVLLSFLVCGCESKHGPRNHLDEAASPYLRAHADNPVNWHEWGPEALALAKQEDKPLLISVGYASCHWCHVMEEESFMDTMVARVMNENFVPVKIDREQRPDIDQVYLQAAQLISGHSGWPLNAFALPDGRPFFAGTYFPRDQWLSLLYQVRDAYSDENELVVKQAAAIAQGIREYNAIGPIEGADALDRREYAQLYDQKHHALDSLSGGIGGAPKFPMPVIWESFLQHYYLTGERKSLAIVETTLEKMAMGGIYDHIGGGFARYTTDSAWRVPHFEKMLYDNALLVSLYSHAFQVTRKRAYLNVVRETMSFVERELANRDGGYYSSLNADSDGEEGTYYLWSSEEIEKITGSHSRAIKQYFNVTAKGNWKGGKNILYTTAPLDSFARDAGLTAQAWDNMLSTSKSRLLDARSKRVSPARDEKILTSWNALMIMAALDAFRACSEKRYLARAIADAQFLEEHMMQDDGRLYRSYFRGKPTIDAFLDDYTNLALAFIRLYEVTFEIRWLKKAQELVRYARAHFIDEGTGLFYYTPDRSTDLFVRRIEISDEVMPASNSTMAEVLMLLGEFFPDSAYTGMSMKMMKSVGDRFGTSDALYYANWEQVAGMMAWRPIQVAVTGPEAQEIAQELQRSYNPLAVFCGGVREDLPLLEHKLVPGRTIIYVCRDRVCKLPVESTDEALRQMAETGEERF